MSDLSERERIAALGSDADSDRFRRRAHEWRKPVRSCTALGKISIEVSQNVVAACLAVAHGSCAGRRRRAERLEQVTGEIVWRAHQCRSRAAATAVIVSMLSAMKDDAEASYVDTRKPVVLG